METTLKLAALLIPLVFIIAALHFAHQALLPLILPLLLIAAVTVVLLVWSDSRRPPE